MAKSQHLWAIEQRRKNRESLRRAKRRRNCTIVVFFAAIIAVIVIVARGCGGTGGEGEPQSEPAQTPSQTNDVPEAAVTGDVPVSDTGVMATAAPGMEFVASIDEEELDLSCFSNSAFIGNALADSVSMYNILPDTDFYTGVNINLENVYTTASGYSSTAIADQLKSKKFSRVFLSFGELELAWKSAPKFGSAYHNLIDKVKEYQPSASIYVISIPPVTKTASDANLYGANLVTIKEYNRRIRNLAYSEGLYYVDSVAALGRQGGYLMEGASYDGINLNKEYIIELMNYIDRKAYIPKTPASDVTEEEEDAVEEKEEATEAAQSSDSKTAEQDREDNEPKPTVNVFKDSAISKYD